MKELKDVKICHMTITRQNAIPRILREANSAVRAGMECVIISPGEDRYVDGIHFIGVPVATSRVERLLKIDRFVYEKACESDADIYQIHDPELLAYGVRLKKRGKKVIFDSHEFYGMQIAEKTYIPQWLRKFVSKAYMAYERHKCNSIDATMYVCTVNGKNYFENRAKRHLCLPNYPEVESFPVRPMDVEPCDGARTRIIYAGALAPQRGITQLVEAAKKANARLVLCGIFASQQYKEEIFSYGSDVIEYKGVLSLSALASEYSAVSIGISTLLPLGQYHVIDTLPTKVFEYCWMKLPVIISDYPYAREVNEKYHFGLCVDPQNASAIAEAIVYLRDHPEEAREMGENGHRAVEASFNWLTQENTLLDLYRELVGDTR